MLSLPGSRIFKVLVSSGFIKASKWSISELIEWGIRWDLADLFALYEMDKDSVLAILALQTLFHIDNWMKYSTQEKVEKEENKIEELAVNPDNYSIKDNSLQYSMVEELADDNGYMDVEDLASDIICTCLSFLSGDYDMGEKGRLSPLPWNVLERRLYKISNELHLRAAVPVLDDDTGRYDAMDAMSEVLPALEGAGGTELIHLDNQLVKALYSGKASEDKTFLDWTYGYACMDYFALRRRINYLRRTKTGRGAVEALCSSLGMGKTAIARFIKNGYAQEVEETATSRRGRPRKDAAATPTVKRGRGRPRKQA